MNTKTPPLQRSPYQEELDWCQRVIDQQRTDQNKVIAIHKPLTACLAKGKAHQKYEFGNQVGLMATGGQTMIITAIGAFEGNPHDRQTIQPLLEPQESIVGLAPKELVVDRGGRGKHPMGNTMISMPGKPLKRDSPLSKAKEEEKVSAPSGHGATHPPSQNRTSPARKRSDGRPIPNDQRLFGCDGVAFKEIHGTTSSRGSFLLFQKISTFSSKSFDHKNNITTTDKKDFLRSN
ncbi:MAG: hypothetical protein OXE55_06850 [Flavobacteriaceae bacterium]|nr:hypothetical protein [Flavobacteriaceae bacterium]